MPDADIMNSGGSDGSNLLPLDITGHGTTAAQGRMADCSQTLGIDHASHQGVQVWKRLVLHHVADVIPPPGCAAISNIYM